MKKVNPEKSRTISKKSRDENIGLIPSRKSRGPGILTNPVPSRPEMKFLGTLDTAAECVRTLDACTAGLLQTKTFVPAGQLASGHQYTLLQHFSILSLLIHHLPLCTWPACSPPSLLLCALPSPWQTGPCPPPPQHDSSQTIQRCPSVSLVLFQILSHPLQCFQF